MSVPRRVRRGIIKSLIKEKGGAGYFDTISNLDKKSKIGTNPNYALELTNNKIFSKFILDKIEYAKSSGIKHNETTSKLAEVLYRYKTHLLRSKEGLSIVELNSDGHLQERLEVLYKIYADDLESEFIEESENDRKAITAFLFSCLGLYKICEFNLDKTHIESGKIKGGYTQEIYDTFKVMTINDSTGGASIIKKMLKVNCDFNSFSNNKVLKKINNKILDVIVQYVPELEDTIIKDSSNCISRAIEILNTFQYTDKQNVDNEVLFTLIYYYHIAKAMKDKECGKEEIFLVDMIESYAVVLNQLLDSSYRHSILVDNITTNPYIKLISVSLLGVPTIERTIRLAVKGKLDRREYDSKLSVNNFTALVDEGIREIISLLNSEDINILFRNTYIEDISNIVNYLNRNKTEKIIRQYKLIKEYKEHIEY